MTRGVKKNLNALANHLKLNSIYEDLFSKQYGKSNFENECNVLQKHHNIGNGRVRKLCNQLVYFLEEIANIQDEKSRDDRCAYLTHWLYDKIGGIHNTTTTNIDKIPFATDIINVGQKVSKQISVNTCYLGHDVGVSLKDLKERKMLFIYFKKYESIKNRMENIEPGACDKYDAYINYINLVYKTYRDKICHRYLSSSSIPDYFDCNDKYDHSNLLPLVKQCKSRGPSTPTHIANRYFGRYTEVEDSVSEDEAGSGSDEVEYDVGLESGDEEDVVLTNLGGRTNVELARRRISGSEELEERRRTAGFGGMKFRIPSREDVRDSEQRQLSRARREETEIVPGTSEPTWYSFITYYYNFLDKALKSKYFRYSFIVFSMLLVILVMYHYYKSINSAESILPKRKRKSHAFNNYKADLCAKEITNGRGRVFMDPLLQQMNLSYQLTQIDQE